MKDWWLQQSLILARQQHLETNAQALRSWVNVVISWPYRCRSEVCDCEAGKDTGLIFENSSLRGLNNATLAGLLALWSFERALPDPTNSQSTMQQPPSPLASGHRSPRDWRHIIGRSGMGKHFASSLFLLFMVVFVESPSHLGCKSPLQSFLCPSRHQLH